LGVWGGGWTSQHEDSKNKFGAVRKQNHKSAPRIRKGPVGGSGSLLVRISSTREKRQSEWGERDGEGGGILRRIEDSIRSRVAGRFEAKGKGRNIERRSVVAKKNGYRSGN